MSGCLLLSRFISNSRVSCKCNGIINSTIVNDSLARSARYLETCSQWLQWARGQSSDLFRQCVRAAHEKAARLPADHPKNLALCGSNEHRLQRSSWRKEATRLLDTLPSELRDRKPLCLLQTPPWISRAVSWLVFTDIQGSGRAADHEALKSEILRCIETWKSQVSFHSLHRRLSQ